MALALANDYLTVGSLRDMKFNLQAACSICSEEFDTKVRVPKVLPCGHTFCVECLKQLLNSLQIAYVGRGEVMVKLKCPTCRQDHDIPSNKAAGYPNNYQLMEASDPQDCRFLKCTICDLPGIESSFHICRECTIETHGYDIQTIIQTEPVVHPDAYTICSTCILKDHNSTGHTVINYAPLRLDHQFRKNMMSANVLAAQISEKFMEVRSILAIMPTLVEKKETEVSRMVEMMQRGKTSHSQKLIFQLYKKEMSDINTILDSLIKDGGKLNEMVRAKFEILAKSNAEINSIHCISDIPILRDILKISDVVPIEPLIPAAELNPEAAELTDASPNPLPFPQQQQLSPFQLIGSGSQTSPLETVFLKMWEGAVWIYQAFSVQTPSVFTGNNYNQEMINDERKKIMTMAVVAVFVSIILIKFLF